MKCIKCQKRKAGATPELCYPCLEQVATEWYLFNNSNNFRLFDPEIRRVYVKNYINTLQKKIKKARKEHA